MSISPIITFKAGKCDADFDVTPTKITPVAAPGFLYLYSEDDLLHFCWRPRDASVADPELKLVMVPSDAYFRPYVGVQKVPKTSPVNGRIFVLKFRSSAQRYWFWLQSREQPPGQPKKFSPRDLRLGEIVNSLLQGEELDTSSEIANLRNQPGAGGDDDDDTMMEDADGQQDIQPSESTGGAGADATGGDVRDEGEGSREGGADGARAAGSSNPDTTQANAVIANFLNSLKRGGSTGSPGTQNDKVFATLADLLTPTSTIPTVESSNPSFVEDLLARHLPASLVFLEHEVDVPDTETDEETLRASVQALGEEQQVDIVKRVLRSPQFSQGLGSLTSALGNGGLPTISEALGVPVKNGGFTGPDRRTPLTGGGAIEAFLEGIKDTVDRSENEGSG